MIFSSILREPIFHIVNERKCNPISTNKTSIPYFGSRYRQADGPSGMCTPNTHTRLVVDLRYDAAVILPRTLLSVRVGQHKQVTLRELGFYSMICIMIGWILYLCSLGFVTLESWKIAQKCFATEIAFEIAATIRNSANINREKWGEKVTNHRHRFSPGRQHYFKLLFRLTICNYYLHAKGWRMIERVNWFSFANGQQWRSCESN